MEKTQIISKYGMFMAQMAVEMLTTSNSVEEYKKEVDGKKG